MPRICSNCGNNGHNSRTCATEGSAGDGEERGIMLFGVRVTAAPSAAFRKSVSMNSLSQLDASAALDSNNPEHGYASDAVVHSSSTRSRERRRGTPWTEDEHRRFLLGLGQAGKGDWRGISRNFVKTRTPTQVASHAQKYFLRRSNLNRRRRRTSLFDITTDSFTGTPVEEKQTLAPMELHVIGSEMLAFPAPLPMIGEKSEELPQGPSNEAASSTVFRPVPIHMLQVPPSQRMAGLNLNQNTAAPEPLRLSLNLTAPSSSPSSSNQQGTRGSRASVFQTMSNTGEGIMGIA